MTAQYLVLVALISFAAGAGFTWSSRGELGTLLRLRPLRFWTIAVCFSACVGLAAYIAEIA